VTFAALGDDGLSGAGASDFVPGSSLTTSNEEESAVTLGTTNRVMRRNEPMTRGTGDLEEVKTIGGSSSNAVSASPLSRALRRLAGAAWVGTLDRFVTVVKHKR
jgi:hypothetical protein